MQLLCIGEQKIELIFNGGRIAWRTLTNGDFSACGEIVSHFLEIYTWQACRGPDKTLIKKQKLNRAHRGDGAMPQLFLQEESF